MLNIDVYPALQCACDGCRDESHCRLKVSSRNKVEKAQASSKNSLTSFQNMDFAQFHAVEQLIFITYTYQAITCVANNGSGGKTDLIGFRIQ